MSKVYEAWDGDRTIRNAPFAEIAFDKVFSLLNVQQSNRKAALGETPPRFRVAGSNRQLDDYRDAVAIYIEVEDNEVRNLTGWKSGWYLIIMTPVEAKRRLGVL